MRRRRKKQSWKLAMILFAFICYSMIAWNIQAGAGDEDIVVLEEGATRADIQRALNRNSTSDRMHLTVKIPAGNYFLDQTLYVYSNTTVIADENAIFTLDPEKKIMLSSYNYKYDKGGYEHIKNVEINGGQWDGSGASGEMIRFIHGQNITIRNVTVRNVSGGAHELTFAGVKNGLIENCHLGDYRGEYTKIKEAIHLDVVHNQYLVPGTVTYDDTANQDIIIRNNTIENYPRGIGSHSFVEGVYQKNITITGNTLKNIAEEAINIYGYENCQVTDNVIEDVNTGIRMYTLLATGKHLTALSNTKKEEVPSDYAITIQNNRIKNAGKYGIQLIGHKNFPVTGVSILNNTIQKTGDSGIMLYTYVKQTTVKQNQITGAGNQGIGIYVASSFNQLIKNQIKTSKSNGIFISGSKGTKLVGNTISNSKQHGIWLAKGSDQTKVIQNKISTSKKIGIGMVDCKKNIIKNNQVINASQFGLYSKGCKATKYIENHYQKIKGKQEYIA
ncbi:MAG: right-handed parallel beta-helix repeat-containing protein [Clostridiales bacterium]|nr:right-handed parallel beta-helix repeat-containing protein [Clostridiales bacterium]